MKRLKILIQLGLILVFAFGCGPAKFVYKSPEIESPKGSGLVLAYRNVEDQREDRKIDEAYKSKNPVKDVERIIEEEIRSTGLFEKVFLVSEEQLNDQSYLKENNVRFLMGSVLKELKWEVPKYGAKVTGAMAATFLTGLIGGLIYGSINTDVNGNIILKVSVTDVSTGKLYIDKEYVGRCTERKAMLSCDTPETKATVVGNSLKSAMDQFKSDLIEVVNGRSNETARESSGQPPESGK